MQESEHPSVVNFLLVECSKSVMLVFLREGLGVSFIFFLFFASLSFFFFCFFVILTSMEFLGEQADVNVCSFLLVLSYSFRCFGQQSHKDLVLSTIVGFSFKR